MSDLRAKINRCESAVFKTGIVLSLTTALVGFLPGHLSCSLISGYFLGFACFNLLTKTFTSQKKNSRIIGLLLGHFKLIILAFIIYYLHTLGFSLPAIAAGVFICQITILFSFITTLHPNRENAERLLIKKA